MHTVTEEAERVTKRQNRVTQQGDILARARPSSGGDVTVSPGDRSTQGDSDRSRVTGDTSGLRPPCHPAKAEKARTGETRPCRVFAIDPGEKQSGWVLLDVATSRVIDSGVADNDDMRPWIRDGQGADLFAIEMAESFGQPVWSQVFTTVRWTGRFVECWVKPSEARFVTRSEVKLNLLGKRAGTDVLIRQALIELLGEPGTKKNPGPTYGVTTHAWAALAVAVTALERMGVRVDPKQRELAA